MNGLVCVCPSAFKILCARVSKGVSACVCLSVCACVCACVYVCLCVCVYVGWKLSGAASVKSKLGVVVVVSVQY